MSATILSRVNEAVSPSGNAFRAPGAPPADDTRRPSSERSARA
jgi:hypothetical protein